MESITITLTKGRKHRHHLKPLYRLLITSLAAIAAARMIMLAVDIAASRLGPAGGELTIPAYVIIFIYFGWSLRGWIAEAHRAERRRKETTPCNFSPRKSRGKGLGDLQQSNPPRNAGAEASYGNASATVGPHAM